jgi:hypothetical protein
MADTVDPAIWDGIDIKSTNVGGRKKDNSSLYFNGVQYVTEGEVLLARLLTAMRVPFTPNVKIILKPPRSAKTNQDVIYVPDFIFNKKAFVWRNEDGSEEIVHGIEAKGLHARQKTAKGKEKVRLLREQRGINVKMLSTDEIRCFSRDGGLPMAPLNKK